MTPSDFDHVATALVGVLVDAALRALVIGCVAGLALTFLRLARPALRLCAWTTVLGAAILMPAVGWLSPTLRWPVPIALPLDQWSLGIPLDAEPPRTSPVARREASQPRLDASRVHVAVSSLSSRAIRATSVISWPVAAAAIYVLGLSFLLLRIAIGWAMVARLRRRALKVTDPRALARLRSTAAVSGLRQSPCLAETPDLHVPMTINVARPVVLLPDGWRAWETATLDAVLVHELAHVARCDALTQRLSLVYRAVFWFSPFSWWLHRRLVDLGEQASDDVVLEGGAEQIAYAETILEFLAAIQHQPRRAEWHVGMASCASAERRVERILSWKSGPTMRLTRAAVFGVVLAAAPIAMLTASARPVLVPAEPLPPAPAPSAVMHAWPPPTMAWPGTITTVTGLAPEPPARTPEQPPLPSNQDAPAPQGLRIIAPTSREISTDRLIVLLFDQSMLPGEDLQRAVDTASRFVGHMRAREEVGLDVIHLVSVATFGSTLQTVQDFTFDKDTIQAVLARESTMTRGTASSASNDARLKAMTTLCDGLGKITPEKVAEYYVNTGTPRGFWRHGPWPALRSVLYFGTGVIRGLQSPVDRRELASPCTRDNLLFYVVDMPGLSGSFAP